jgi:hypothetical protein
MQFQEVKVGWKFNLRTYFLKKDYYFGIKRSTRIKEELTITCHLKGCMEGDFRKE